MNRIIFGLAIAMCVGCGDDKPKTEVNVPGAKVKAGTGGTEINVPGVNVKTGPGGTEVKAPGVEVKTKKD